jgi:hypothetical protein
MIKAEKFSAPSASQYSNGVTYNGACHGNSGPLGVQYDPDAYVLSSNLDALDPSGVAPSTSVTDPSELPRSSKKTLTAPSPLSACPTPPT